MFSIVKRRTESLMPNVRNGIIRLTVVDNRLTVPYSAVVRQFVYSGTRKKLIALANPGSTHRLRNFEPASGVGPAEFIGYVQNAYCVLTSSFHGTVFSILYEKPFLTYCQDVLGNRQRNLLERLGLLSHLWELDKDTDPAEVWKNTDCEQVRSRLSSERERSERFLAENI